MSHFPFQSFDNVFLSIVVPVFNDVKNIKSNLKLLTSEVSQVFRQYEIIVVSDGSFDGTSDAILAMDIPRIVPIILEKNQGKGAALKRGFEHASGQYVMFIDGGMEIHPREIKIFLGLMFLYDADMVVGSKRHPQSTVYYPFYRKFLSYLYQLLVRSLFKVNITDTQVGIKMFRSEVLKDVVPHLQIRTYGFDLEVLALAAKMGHTKILEAPVRLDYFLNGKPSLVRDMFHTLKVGILLMRDTLRLWQKLQSLPGKNR
jgi:glycosyltransferase involved in cell wall biosynthesis